MIHSYSLGAGWYIDNVALNGVIFDNADDIIQLAYIPTYSDIDFLVTLNFPGCVGTDGIRYLPLVMNVNPAQIDESFLRDIGGLVNYWEMVIIASPNNGPCDYGFRMLNGVYLEPA